MSNIEPLVRLSYDLILSMSLLLLLLLLLLQQAGFITAYLNMTFLDF